MSATKSFSPRRVLVADGSPAIRRLVSEVVEKEGHVAVAARDGREAFELLQNGADFAACIFDVTMSYMRGPALLRYMRTEEHLKRIPVLMMTAERDPHLTSESFAAGAMVFLNKPFTQSQLQLMLRLAIGPSLPAGPGRRG